MAKPCYHCRERTKAKARLDGRTFCAPCTKANVFDQAQADRLSAKVQKYVAQKLKGVQIDRHIDVMLVEDDELQTKGNRLGRASSSRLAFYQAYNPEIIFIVSGLSPEMFCGTMIHEYTHAWQSRNCPSQDRGLTEGFANWIEYHYLMDQGHSYEAYRVLSNAHPDYGPTVRKILALEKKYGQAKVFGAVTKVSNLVELEKVLSRSKRRF